jgi:hypothetical protein
MEQIAAGEGVFALSEAFFPMAYIYVSESPWLAPIASAAWSFNSPMGANVENPFALSELSEYANVAGEAADTYLDSLENQNSESSDAQRSCPTAYSEEP